MSQATFHYRAIDRRGLATKGTILASDRKEAYKQISASGLQPIKIRQKHRLRRAKSITLKDLSQLSYQFAVLLEAQIPIVDGFRSIAEQESNPLISEAVNQIALSIESGSTVTESLLPHRKLFGDVYIDSIRAAEASGNMIEVMGNLADMFEREYEMSKAAKGAMTYPLCVVGALILALGFLMTVVVPRFASMFASRGVDLPLPTQLLMGLSYMLTTYWYVFLIGGMAGFFSFRRAWSQKHFRNRIDKLLHRIPFVRDLLQGIAISRFVRVFGICLRSGLGLIEALEISGRASGRPLLQEDTDRMIDQVREGGRLSEVFIVCPYFPPFTRRMLSAGEEAADLSKMCEIVSRHYDREVMGLAKNISTIIEPIFIVGLAVVVLVVALAIFLPMWNMGSLVT